MIALPPAPLPFKLRYRVPPARLVLSDLLRLSGTYNLRPCFGHEAGKLSVQTIQVSRDSDQSRWLIEIIITAAPEPILYVNRFLAKVCEIEPYASDDWLALTLLEPYREPPAEPSEPTDADRH